MGPCAGGAVYSPAITDFIFMVKETSHMFITGPDVIKTVTGEEVGFEELGGAMTPQHEVGRRALRAPRTRTTASRTRATCSRSCRRTTSRSAPRAAADRRPAADGPGARRVVPDNPNKPYDMRDVIRRVVDDGEFLEVHEHYAPQHRLRLRAARRRLRSASSATSRRAGRRARHRRLREGRALRPHLRRVQHPAHHLRRRARLPARARRRSGAGSSATARSCSTPSPRRRSRRSR